MTPFIGRREFTTLVGGTVATWPLAARGQQAGKVPRIGFLGSATPAGSAKAVESLRRLPHLVTDSIATNVDVLITHGTPGTRVAKEATTTIPIVMAISGDAIATGLVSSLARPEANLARDRLSFFHNSMRSDWNCSRRHVRAFPVRPRSQIPTILSADRWFQQCRQPPRP